MKKTISVILIFAIVLCFSGCKASKAADLMENIAANPTDAEPTGAGDAPVFDREAGSLAAADFGVRLFQQSLEPGKNTLISPLSVLCALAMTANGAAGETLAQMEAVLGMSVEDLNCFLYGYMDSLPQGEKGQLNLANSIWFRDDPRLTVEPDFLQTNADYYGAGIYKAPFDDATLNQINDWVKEHTDGMIPKILDEIPEEAVMYLVNALAFEAEWQSVYREDQISDGSFTTGDGTEVEASFMHSEEGKYLEDDSATGFVKYYAEGNYAFVALLPKEGVSVEDYVAGLTAAHLRELLANPENVVVYAAIPKFQTEYSVEMSEILSAMGMTDAFDGGTADLSRLGASTAGNLYINRVLHKTFIAVDEQGTKAGAVTAVEVVNECAALLETKTVTLDRPFVYLLIDCQNNLPFFLGTMMDVSPEG